MSIVLASYSLSANARLEITQGDLTQENVDAIVNAANAHLAHGGGIAAAIAKKGGSSIQAESEAWVREYGPVSHAQPAYTHGGKLPARYVIHAVGPIWGTDGPPEVVDAKLADALRGSLQRAEELGLHSIAFPAISTGIFRFPKDRAAHIFFQTFRQYFADHPASPLTLVRLTLWGDEDVKIFLEAAKA